MPIFKTHIPRSIKVAEAVLYHKTICEFMPNNPAASAKGKVPEPAGILEMDFARMEPFPNHKFKLYEGQQLADMVESIRPMSFR